MAALPYALAVVLKLWLLSDYSVIPIAAPHDDYLFVRLALSILDRQWLGAFGFLTLSKGPFFAMWLAAMHLLSLPYILALQLTYLLACAVFILALRPFHLARHWLFLIFTVLWFSPASIAATDFRVERSALYPSLVLLSVAFAIGLTVRCCQSGRVSQGWAIGLGASFAAFWLTREEGVWLLPTFIVIIGGALLREWRLHSKRWTVLLSSWVIAAGLFLACLAGVAGLNYVSYGRFMLVSTQDSAFLAAYRAITRVADDSPRLMTPVSRKAIDKAASVSPAFAEIRPILVNGYKSWREFSKTMWIEMYPDGAVKEALRKDDDAIGGYFAWDLMEAVALAGYYKNAATAHSYYSRVADELNGACSKGRITCGVGEDTVPGILAAPPAALVSSLARTLQLSIVLPTPAPPGGCGDANGIVRNEFARLTRSAFACDGTSALAVRGWVVTKHPNHNLVAYDGGHEVWHLAGFVDSPDVAEHLHGTEWESRNPGKARFEAYVPCSQCELALEIDGVAVKSAPVWQWLPDCFRNDEWQMCIDDNMSETSRLDRFMSKRRRSTLMFVDRAYHYGVPIIGGIGLALACVRLRKHFQSQFLMLAFASACLLGVAVRAFILAWVDATSFPSVAFQYTHASYPLLLTGIMLLIANPRGPDAVR